jgi:uncharacterized protein YjeT (DUF2065 family)
VLLASELLAGQWRSKTVKMLDISEALKSVAAHEGQMFAECFSPTQSGRIDSVCWAKALGMALVLRYSRSGPADDRPAVRDDINLALFEVPAIELLAPLRMPKAWISLHVKLPPELWELVDNEVRASGVPQGVLLSGVGINHLVKIGRFPPEFAWYKPGVRRGQRLVAA